MLPKNLKWAEIGVFKGEFSDKILTITDPVLIYLVDPWERPAVNGGKDGNYDEWINDMPALCHQLQNKYLDDPRVIFWRVYSDEFFRHMISANGKINAIYIDAEHDYESVKKDLKNALQITTHYILGHDYVSPRFEGCVQAVDEFCKENDLRINILTEDGCPSYLIRLK